MAKKIAVKKAATRRVKAVGRNARSVTGILKAIVFLPRTAFNFLKSVRSELKLVDWLSRRDTARWSSAVIGTALGFGGMLVLIDLLFFKLRDLLFTI